MCIRDRFNNDLIERFEEKPKGDGALINGGFFVLSPKVIEFIKDDLTIWEQDNGNIIFTSSELPNQPYNSPGVWNAPENLKLFNKMYQWELVDYDGLNSNDFIASGTFNPIALASNGEITTIGNHTAGNQSQLKIYYTLAP